MNNVNNTNFLSKIIELRDKTSLARAISLVESSKPEHKLLALELINSIFPKTGNSLRIGISGIPGAGKSTFIESLGKQLISQQKRVAVLAVDPSSAVTQGSILGDKTRMEFLSKQENAFIRPSPSKGYYGGVAISTYESMLLCEAAGYETVIIETVGVGQSETMVADMVDVLVLLTVANSGDELQAIKRGIMEKANLIFINKVDGELTQQDKHFYAEVTRGVQLISNSIPDWKTKVIAGSSLQDKNIDEVWKEIQNFSQTIQQNGFWEVQRKQQNIKRFKALLSQTLLDSYLGKVNSKHKYQHILEEVENGEKNAWSALQELLETLNL